jgi:hypothetical protein
MPRVLSIAFVCFSLLIVFFALALGAPPAAAQVYGVVSPSSRTPAQSGAPFTLSGWVLTSGQTVNIEAVDQTTGAMQSLGSVNAATSGATYHALRCRLGKFPPCMTVTYTLYPWSYPVGQLTDNYWAPQLSFGAGVSNSQGHLELFASAGGVTLPTFSADALSLMKQSPLYHSDPETAATQFSDGTSTVLFDQNGVGGAPPAWTTVAGMMANPPPPPPPNGPDTSYPSVALSVGSYTVGPASSPLTIYALICAPNKPGIYPMVVYNHGGINYGPNSPLGDIGSLHGHVTMSKWTAAPATGNDDLGQCVDWAKRGWIFAMSSYRAESIAIVSDDQTVFPTKTWTSSTTTASGASEFCMGEVTDVMALTNLLVNNIANITIGDPNNAADQVHITTSYDEHNPTISWSKQLFMYGYSHGGCVTYRAVEQGAPVDAFAVIEGFTDHSLGYVNTYTGCNLNHAACTTPAGVFDPTGFAAAGSGGVDSTGLNLYYPDATGVMGYNWRSAHYFASRGDLGIRKFAAMPILILHGDIDAGNPVPLDEPAELAADIAAADIFYGPSSDAPANQACIAPPTGAPVVDPTTHEPLSGVPSSCMVPFQIIDNGDPCLTASPLTFAPVQCKVILLPLTQSQQHYLVVYHNMDHVNGGLGIKVQFDRFAEQNFRRKPGCDGVSVSTPTSPFFGPMACNGFY